MVCAYTPLMSQLEHFSSYMRTDLAQFRLDLPNLAVDVLELVLDPGQFRFAGTL